jgi:hypothetical protein
MGDRNNFKLRILREQASNKNQIVAVVPLKAA